MFFSANMAALYGSLQGLEGADKNPKKQQLFYDLENAYIQNHEPKHDDFDQRMTQLNLK
ncbi:hypothetical protein TWF481_006379 [Arthrobotrys musiformis]|uniref:Uncharacterized protein n=1 Tax=Arthrobotrys musiformis TaxID=47236 RepID=A0AAV9WHV0_9PEZI